MSTNETIATWNKMAQLYEQKFMDLTIYNQSYDFLCSSLSANPSTKVLELGCGPGMISKYLLSKRPQLDILGTDLAPNMVEIAKKNVPRAQFQVLDSRDILSLNKHFDAIVSGFCIPYLSPQETQQFIIDSSKTLNIDGLLYLSFVSGNEDQSGYQTGSSGDRVYFHFHTEERILQQLGKNNLQLLKRFLISYERANGEREEHVIIIAQLKKD